MTAVSQQLDIDGFPVEIAFTNNQHMHIRVFKTDGRVQITVPRHCSEADIRSAFYKHRPWIIKKRAEVETAAMQAGLQMAPGALHYVWGQPMLLSLPHQGFPEVTVSECFITLSAPEHYTAGQRQSVLNHFYHGELVKVLPPLLNKWQPIIGQYATKVSLRWMKTRWGSCRPETGSITFNLELVKKDPHCLEYVVVHELTHLIERHHNQHFWSLMDQFLPDWRYWRTELKTKQPAALEDTL